jgi:hypothetical protein
VQVVGYLTTSETLISRGMLSIGAGEERRVWARVVEDLAEEHEQGLAVGSVGGEAVADDEEELGAGGGRGLLAVEAADLAGVGPDLVERLAQFVHHVYQPHGM